MEEKSPSDIYIMDECFDRFCRHCISTYVDIKVKNYEISSIKCPECNHPLSEQEVKLILRMNGEKSMVNKYEEASLKQALASMKNLIWCPNPVCGNAMVFEEGSNNSKEDENPVQKEEFGVTLSEELIPQHLRRNSLQDKSPRQTQQSTQSNVFYQYSPSHHIAPSESITLNINVPLSPLPKKVDPDAFFTTMALEDTPMLKQRSKSFGELPLSSDNQHLSPLEQNASTSFLSSNSMSQLPRLEDIKPKPLYSIECGECKWKICTQCRQRAHPNQTCEEAKSNTQKSQDLELSNWMAQHKAKECPFCSMKIEKTMGCNTMTCGNCKNKFCWSCNYKFDGTNEEVQKKIRDHFSSGTCYKYNFFEFINPF